MNIRRTEFEWRVVIDETLPRCLPVLAAARGLAQVHPAARLRSAERSGVGCTVGLRDRVLHAAIKMRLKHGAYTKEALQRRAEMRELIREARKLLKELG